MKFKKGDSVRLTKFAARMFPKLNRKGIVKNTPRKKFCVPIILDGHKTVQYWHVSFVRKDSPNA